MAVRVGNPESVICNHTTHRPAPFKVLMKSVNLTSGFLYKRDHEERAPNTGKARATKSPLRALEEVPHWAARWRENDAFPLQMSSGAGLPPARGLPAPPKAKPNRPTHLKTKLVSSCLPLPVYKHVYKCLVGDLIYLGTCGFIYLEISR